MSAVVARNRAAYHHYCRQSYISEDNRRAEASKTKVVYHHYCRGYSTSDENRSALMEGLG